MSEELIFPVDIYCKHMNITRTAFFNSLISSRLEEKKDYIKELWKKINKKLLSFKFNSHAD